MSEKPNYNPTKFMIVGFEAAVANDKPVIRSKVVDSNGNLTRITHWLTDDPFPLIDNGFAGIRALAVSAAKGEVTKATCADTKTPIGEYLAAAKKAIVAGDSAATLAVLRSTSKAADNLTAGNGEAVAEGLAPAAGYVVSLQCSNKPTQGKSREFQNYSACGIGKQSDTANPNALFLVVHGRADAFGGKALDDWQAIASGGGSMSPEQREAMRQASIAAMEAGGDDVDTGAASGDIAF